MIKDEELDEIEKRTDAASKCPWIPSPSIPERGLGAFIRGVARDMTDEDAAFISHARDDIPRLVEEVRWLKSLLRK